MNEVHRQPQQPLLSTRVVLERCKEITESELTVSHCCNIFAQVLANPVIALR